ncbi:hypothetical protein TNCV_2582261 [Trichonephila clavipes]|nr:hypothetical protein TNCV_2582261 [Trichonephila clavipes]
MGYGLCFPIADLIHSPEAGISFSVTPYRRIPIAAAPSVYPSRSLIARSAPMIFTSTNPSGFYDEYSFQ